MGERYNMSVNNKKNYGIKWEMVLNAKTDKIKRHVYYFIYNISVSSSIYNVCK
jgi:hypothetical protein